MAISLSKFVDVRTTWPKSDPEQRTLGGLVFTTDEVSSSASDSALKTEIEKNGPVALDEDQIKDLFGETSDVYKFAKRYYGYYTSAGKSPCALTVVKMATKASATSATANAATADSAAESSETAKTVSSTAKAKALKSAVVAPLGASGNYETPEEALKRLDAITTMFGSFTFLGTYTDDALAKAYKLNASYDGRFLAVHCIVAGETDDETNGKYTVSSAAGKCATNGAFNGIKGLCVVYGSDKYTAAIPMAIFASTDYDAANSVVCQMFKQHDDETPTVASDADYKALRSANVNFYGTTQSNGKKISFYMPGYNVDGTDTAIYCNEIWFKSRCTTDLFDLLMTESRIPANDDGITMVKDVVLDRCVAARTNGVFMAKTPSTAEQRNVKKLCSSVGLSDEQGEAVVSSVETSGYGVVAYFGKNDDGDNAVIYYVFYGTADSIRFVKGNDVLVSGE